MRMAPPSPITNPALLALNGRDAYLGSVARESALAFANPAIPSGMVAYSQPPVIIASACPPATARNASPMQCDEVAHAVTMSRQGPCAKFFMAMWPAAMLLIIEGMNIGEIHCPLGSSTILAISRNMISNPPIPEPTYTPRRKGSMLAPSPWLQSPASSIAWCAAATPYWVNMPCLRTKALIFPAMCAGRSEVSYSVMVSIPQTPFLRFSQKVGTSFPIGEMIPSPVTTTL